MHRKSMEAAHTLSNDILGNRNNNEDDDTRTSSEENEIAERKPKIDEKDDFRSNSIAALRAKAQEHSAKMFSLQPGSGVRAESSAGGVCHSQSHFPHQLENSQSVF